MEPITIGILGTLAYTTYKALTGPKTTPAPKVPIAPHPRVVTEPLDQSSHDLITRVWANDGSISPQEITQFQGRWGLPQTGLLDLITLRAMGAMLPPPSDAVEHTFTPEPIVTVQFRPGMAGNFAVIQAKAFGVSENLKSQGPSRYSRAGVSDLQESVGLPQTGLYDAQTKMVLDAVVQDAPPVYTMEPSATMALYFAAQKSEAQTLMEAYDVQLEKWRENVIESRRAGWSDDALEHFTRARQVIEMELRQIGEKLKALGIEPKPWTLENVPWPIPVVVAAANAPPPPPSPETDAGDVDIRTLPAGDPRRMSPSRG